ncbi:DUF2585 domain-containing protein [Rhizobiaceae bacterium n13]|uniref:UPF0314 protein MRS75_16590 n=1 Tax=Ferirhizobium litorale TaxID=2927786 RepID=A0AAE3QGU6_9HYPH|nr:DUF2585 domain-containing protein [Fererhizobium litorale]MDI7862413.1 DUF2585 domain-containing protein [Fererhizobium litorale]MDI7923700.1 DUF2585 domain-containing protein [Fererhizobium litorale]
MTIAEARGDRVSRHTRYWLAAGLAVIVVQALVEHFMGRIWICECGYVKLWEGVVNGSGNSQHLADWYTPSHIIHGFIFYGLTHLFMRNRTLAARLFVALLLEAGWEIAENTPMVIDRYRAATIAFDYTGDSIINSVMDTVFMALGFLFAARMPVAVTMAVAIVFELFTGWMIRDNLTLNVLMLVWPLDAVKAWQGGI